MLNSVKLPFRAPSAETIALRELEAAKRELLQMQDTHEYAAKMVDFYEGKINRLTLLLKHSTS